MAFAPSLDLLGVPSSSSRNLSTPRWSLASQPTIISNDLIDILDRFQHPLAPVPALISVAKLQCLMRSSQATGDGRAPPRAIAEDDLDFDGRVAARVQDLLGRLQPL